MTATATRKSEDTNDAGTTGHAASSRKRTGTETSVRRKGVADVTEESAEGVGARGDVPGYVPTLEDLRLREVYGDWVYGNPGTHLDGGVAEYGLWQGLWRDLVVIPPRQYEAPSGKVGRRFVNALVGELRGVRDRRWNLEHFIVFQTVTLQRARHVTASRDIQRRIEKRMDAWEAGRYGMQVEDTLRSYTQYLTAVRREETTGIGPKYSMAW